MTALESASFGSGKDVVTVAMTDTATAVNLGAGADTINVNATAAAGNKALTVTPSAALMWSH
ncbi:MAG: hypothetical protein MZV65_46625 [Chromatiales bacterium]|nr:hypothetical protein [Chromatiales bacterium]